MSYDKEVANKIKEMIAKYCKDWDIPEHAIIQQRRLAILLVIEKIERWLVENKVKDFKVKFNEYSNACPLLEISLLYKDKHYDHYGIYFERDEWAFLNQSHTKPNFHLWLPGHWYNFFDKCHTQNQKIFDKLMEKFTIEKLGLMVNYPFIFYDYDDSNWIFKQCNNMT